MKYVTFAIGDTAPNGSIINEAWCREVSSKYPTLFTYNEKDRLLTVDMDAMKAIMDSVKQTFNVLTDIVQAIYDRMAKAMQMPEFKEFVKAVEEAQEKDKT